MGLRGLIFGLLLVAPAAALAAPLPRYGAFVYSNLCIDRSDTGDLNGDRLILVRLQLHDSGYLEWSDGSLSSAPLQDLKIDDKSGKISFRYLQDFDAATGKSNVVKNVSSTISAESAGLISWNGKPFRIKRVYDLKKELPNCPKK